MIHLLTILLAQPVLTITTDYDTPSQRKLAYADHLTTSVSTIINESENKFKKYQQDMSEIEIDNCIKKHLKYDESSISDLDDESSLYSKFSRMSKKLNVCEENTSKLSQKCSKLLNVIEKFNESKGHCKDEIEMRKDVKKLLYEKEKKIRRTVDDLSQKTKIFDEKYDKFENDFETIREKLVPELEHFMKKSKYLSKEYILGDFCDDSGLDYFEAQLPNNPTFNISSSSHDYTFKLGLINNPNDDFPYNLQANEPKMNIYRHKYKHSSFPFLKGLNYYKYFDGQNYAIDSGDADRINSNILFPDYQGCSVVGARKYEFEALSSDSSSFDFDDQEFNEKLFKSIQNLDKHMMESKIIKDSGFNRKEKFFKKTHFIYILGGSNFNFSNEKALLNPNLSIFERKKASNKLVFLENIKDMEDLNNDPENLEHRIDSIIQKSLSYKTNNNVIFVPLCYVRRAKICENFDKLSWEISENSVDDLKFVSFS